MLLPVLMPTLALWIAGCGDSNPVTQARDQARELTRKTTNLLARFEAGDLSDLDGVRLKVRSLRASLATNDYTQARAVAEQVDQLLKTRYIAPAVDFLKIESVEGATKAKEALEGYMARNNLGELDTKAFQRIQAHFARMDRKERGDLVYALIYLGLEQKLGHRAAAPAALTQVVLEELMGGPATSNPPPTVAAPALKPLTSNAPAGATASPTP